MRYKGGSVLFDDPQKDIKAQILQIFDLATDITVFNTPIRNIVIVYKLIFQEPLYDILYGIDLASPRQRRPDDVSPSTLIIKYMYDRIDSHEFTNERQIYSDIASSTNGNNIFPISPNHIYSEIIQTSEGELTAIGKSFFELLRKFHKIEKHETHITKALEAEEIVDEKADYKKSIIIMEMIEGDTLDKRLIKQKLSEVSEVSVLSEKLSFTFDINFLRRFFTLYLLTLLAKKGYSHGDPHTGNIMLTHTSTPHFFLHSLGALLTRHNMNVVPYIIDFGEGALLTSLQFKEFSTEILSSDKFMSTSLLYHELYAIIGELNLHVTPIISIIDEYLLSGKYVEAILITTMCSSNNKSMFQKVFDDDSTAYVHLFTIKNEEAQILNSLIKQAIDDRELLETELKKWQTQQQQIRQKQKELVTKTEPGWLFSGTTLHRDKRTHYGGHYRNKKTRTKNYNKLHKKKINNTRKLKKLKTRKIRKIRKTRKTRN